MSRYNVDFHGYMTDIFIDTHYLQNPMGNISQPSSPARRSTRFLNRIDPSQAAMNKAIEDSIKQSRTYLAANEAKMFRGKGGRIRIAWKGKTLGGFFPNTYAKWSPSYQAKFWESIAAQIYDTDPDYDAKRIIESWKYLMIRRHTDAEESLVRRQKE